MFKILGADGKEYGPVTVEQLKQWITEGRANQETMVQREGGTGWQPLGQQAEFAGNFATPGNLSPTASTPVIGGFDPGAKARAQQMVSAPAVCLIITGGLAIAYSLFGVLGNLLGMGMGMAGARGNADLPPEVARMVNLFGGTLGVGLGLLAVLVSVFILYSGIQMKKLRKYGMAITASILAMIPCFTGLCCLLGLPFGIWSLVVLLRPEVKSQFE